MDRNQEHNFQMLMREPGQRTSVCKHDPVQGDAPRVDPIGRTTTVKKTVLENGIRVVTESMAEMRSVAIGILVEASPRDETPGKNGLAHLVEHLMFQGTSSRDASQIARLMDQGGGSIGAFTARDYTCYFATVLDDYRTYAIDLMGDVLLNSIFPPETLETGKRAILREMAMSQDNPFERVHNLLKTFAWQGHTLGYPIIGTPSSVETLTREDVIYFIHKHYMPDRVIIAAAGSVEHEDFVAQVRDAFWRMLGRGAPSELSPPGYTNGVVLEEMPVSQAYFSIGLKAPSYTHPDRYTLHLLNTVLGGGSSSRLFRRIRGEHGWVYDIGSEYHAYRDAGMLVIEGSTAPEFLLQVLSLVRDELQNLLAGNELIDDEELVEAKRQIRGQHLITSENTNTRMSRLATQELYFGRQIPSQEILSQIEAVDPSSLQSLARDHLVDALKQVSVAVVGPNAPKHYNASLIEERLADRT
jgi:predicted Zn-dependent peptidase